MATDRRYAPIGLVDTVATLAAGTPTTLAALSDVTSAAYTGGFVLVANGSAYEGRALLEADISDLGTYLSNIVEDTTPQLGGALDAQGNNISSVGELEIRDVTLIDTATFSHDGTDFIAAFSGTTDWDITGITSLDLYANMTVRGGNSLFVTDATEADNIQISHDGTDANIVTSGAANLNIGANGSEIVLSPTTYTYHDNDIGGIRFRTLAGATKGYVYHNGTDFGLLTSTGGWAYRIYGGTNNATAYGDLGVEGDLTGKGYIRIYDSTVTDYIQISHDGTDANFASSGTTDVNFTGASTLSVYNSTQNSTVESHVAGDFFPYFELERSGGTTKTNARWTHVVGTSGDYQLSDQTSATTRMQMFQAGNTAHNVPAGSDHIWQVAGNAVTRIDSSATGFYIEDGYNLTIFDATNADYGRFSHNGTDFNTAFTNTTDWNIQDVTNVRFQGITNLIGQDGVTLRLFDATDTSSLDLQVTSTTVADLAASSLTDFRFSGWGSVVVRDGADLDVYDATNADYIRLRETGSNAQITTNTNNIQVSAGGGAGQFVLINGTDLWIRSGGYARIYDATNADYVQLAHTGTNFQLTPSGTSNIDILGGVGLRVYDATNVDSIKLSHNGTYPIFQNSATSGGDFQLYDFQGFTMNALGGSATYNNTYTGVYGICDGTAGAIYFGAHNNYDDTAGGGPTTAYIEISAQGPTYAYSGGFRSHLYATTEDNHQDSFAITGDNGAFLNFWVASGTPQTSYIEVHDGAHLRIMDSAGTDYADISHDGTDLNIASTNTTDVNFTGQTYVKMPTLWTTNTEAVNLSAGNSMVGYRPDTQFFTYDSDSIAHYGITTYSDSNFGGLSLGISGYSGVKFFEAGNVRGYIDSTSWYMRELRASNSTFTTYSSLLHNGTNGFLSTSTGSMYYGSAGGGHYLYQSGVGSFLRIYDSTVTDYVSIAESGSNAQINTNNNNIQINAGGGIVELTGGQTFRIRDATNADHVRMSHDGTDFNIEGQNTTWITTDTPFDFQDNQVKQAEILDYGVAHTTTTITANAVTIDLTNGNSQIVDLDGATGDVTVTLSNPPATGTYGEVQIISVQSTTTRDYVWPGSVTWITNGTPPTPTATDNGVDVIHLFTIDGGTNWYGSYLLKDGVTIGLQDMNDVDLTGAANNDFLYRSGGKWVDTAGALTWNGATLNMYDAVLTRPKIDDYGITRTTATPTGTTQTCDYSTAMTWEIDLGSTTGNITITLSNPPPSGSYGEMTLKVTQHNTINRTITWAGGTFRWPAGTIPTMSTGADAIDIYHFATWDSGTTWYASAIQAMA